MTPEQQAVYPLPPEMSATPGTGVTVIATSTASAATDLLGLDLFGKRLELLAETDIYVGFAAASGTIDETATGTTASTCWLLKAGIPFPCILHPTKHRWLHTKAAAATPKLRIRPASPA